MSARALALQPRGSNWVPEWGDLRSRPTRGAGLGQHLLEDIDTENRVCGEAEALGKLNPDEQGTDLGGTPSLASPGFHYACCPLALPKDISPLN